MLVYNPTAIQEIRHPLLEKVGVRLLVKREDLNHPDISGNKWWKLKYNLEEAAKTDHKTILTFGGAYSNHLYATAAACSELGLKSIGIVRGEKTEPLNATLRFCLSRGMMLHHISRGDYRNKYDPQFIENLQHRFGSFYIVPEGGTNALAVRGCSEFAKNILNKISFDCLVLPVATGGTIAGLISGFEGEKEIIGISVLKHDHINTEIAELVQQFSRRVYDNWKLLTSYHHGGYAKVNKELLNFIHEIREQFDLPLDHVYTGKMMWAIMKEVENGSFRRGSTILALHTGGLQGAMAS